MYFADTLLVFIASKYRQRWRGNHKCKIEMPVFTGAFLFYYYMYFTITFFNMPYVTYITIQTKWQIIKVKHSSFGKIHHP